MPGRRVPHTVRVRMYQVGFGDCFLLSFEYGEELPGGGRARHVLIDFGSTRLPSGARTLVPVAEQVRAHAGGPVDVVVVTHRHKDHLSAFAEDAVAELIGPPKLVVRPWTEDPKLPDAARGPAVAGGPGRQSRGFLQVLQTAQGFAEALASAVEGAPGTEIGRELAALAEDQIPNQAALDRLEGWSDAGKPEYLHYGKASSIGRVIPGVRVRVLGPPTVEQHDRVRSQASSDPDEFWQLYRGLVDRARPLELLRGLSGAAAREEAPEPDDAADDEDGTGRPGRPASESPTGEGVGPIGPVRWLTDKMGRQQLNSFLRIVRIMDDALNNTSLILLFEVDGPAGPARMLFPGDAQIENWEYALKVARNRKTNLASLGRIDLYKVGHHGSRNATPRTLYDLWSDAANADHPMTVLMSTKPGVHGTHAETAVPRRTLVEALERRAGEVYSTSALRRRVAWWEAVADLSRGTSFTVTQGSPD